MAILSLLLTIETKTHMGLCVEKFPRCCDHGNNRGSINKKAQLFRVIQWEREVLLWQPFMVVNFQHFLIFISRIERNGLWVWSVALWLALWKRMSPPYHHVTSFGLGTQQHTHLCSLVSSSDWCFIG